MAKASISATDIAIYHHLNCDLYLWNMYNEPLATKGPQEISELCQAQWHRGEEWESTLFAWLDKSNLLLRVPPIPIGGDVLVENILADDREHFFVADLCFWPPHDRLTERFEAIGNRPVNFGLAKPDLVEVVHRENKIVWKVIDGKASKAVKVCYKFCYKF